MLSFRVDQGAAAAAHLWAERLGIRRSELLRDALRHHLTRLRAEDDIRAWVEEPLSEDERALAGISDWGPAEDWADWSDEEG